MSGALKARLKIGHKAISSLTEAELDTGERDEGGEDDGSAVSADRHAEVVIHPGVEAFDRPALLFTAMLYFENKVSQLDAAKSDRALTAAAVETEDMTFPASATPRPHRKRIT